jgi:hypothetical protein
MSFHTAWALSGHTARRGIMDAEPNATRRVERSVAFVPKYIGRTVVSNRTVLVDPRTHRIMQIIE